LLAPKNLQASNLVYDVPVLNQTLSAWDLDIVRINHYVRNVIESQNLKGTITPEMVIPFLSDDQKAVLYW
jgi:hypothetical protein